MGCTDCEDSQSSDHRPFVAILQAIVGELLQRAPHGSAVGWPALQSPAIEVMRIHLGHASDELQRERD